MPAQPTSANQLPQLADWGGIWRGPHTIDECVNNELPVLLHQVVDVAEDATVEGKTRSAIDHERLFPRLEREARGLCSTKLRHALPKLWASFAWSSQLPPASVWGAKRLPVWQLKLGLSNGTKPRPEHWVGGIFVFLLFIQSVCALLRLLVLFGACSGFVIVVLYIPHLVKLIKQLLCVFLYQSWWVKPAARSAQRCLSRVAESRWVSKARKRVREGDGKLLGRQSRRKMGEERRQNKGQLDGKGCLAQGDGIVL